MRNAATTICLLGLLAACGDPLAGVPRLADVQLAENDPAPQALPTEEEVAREGFFGTDAAGTDLPVGATTEATQPQAVQPAPRGWLGFFRPRKQPESTVAVPAEPVEPPVEGDVVTETSAVDPQPEPLQTEPRKSGLLGLFRRSSSSAVSAEQPVQAEPAEEAVVASLTPENEAAAKPAARGLLGGLIQSSAPTAQQASELPEVSYGTTLPYGVLARNCSAKRQPLGRKVDGGTGGYKLYDSDPGSSVPRTFYITGFDDGCPRQLTAANVLLGAPSLYELLHYGPAGEYLAVGETDRAYEKVKSQVCGVRKGKPCGNRIGRLERSTVFVNAYPRGEGSTTWSEMLIHDGAVLATAQKSSG